MATRARAVDFSFLDYLLLGIVRLHPRVSGYQLRSVIDGSIGYFFHVHLSQIYPSLRRLSDAGYVSYSEMVREGKPNLKLYSVTERGADALRGWLTEPFAFEATRTSADRYFIKLLLMDHLQSDELAAYIDSGIESFSVQQAQIEAGGRRRDSAPSVDADEAGVSAWQLWGAEAGLIAGDLRTRVEWLKRLKADLADAV